MGTKKISNNSIEDTAQQAPIVPRTTVPRKPTQMSPLKALSKPTTIKTIGTFTRNDDDTSKK